MTILILVLTGYYVHGIPSPALLQFIWLGYDLTVSDYGGLCNILTTLTLVLTGYYVHGIPSPALLQFIRSGYGTGLMMAQ
jgi:hypothetical protein